ncbi:hypothetical protein MRX96_042257 [Rhipicephalus microplus]
MRILEGRRKRGCSHTHLFHMDTILKHDRGPVREREKGTDQQFLFLGGQRSLVFSRSVIVGINYHRAKPAAGRGVKRTRCDTQRAPRWDNDAIPNEAARLLRKRGDGAVGETTRKGRRPRPAAITQEAARRGDSA